MEKATDIQEQQEHPNQNWSEAVEDLVAAGDTEGAISLLETLVSKLETSIPSETIDLQLTSALTQLAALYSSKHVSLESEQLLSRASLMKQHALLQSSSSGENVKKDLNKDKASKSNAGSTLSDSVRNVSWHPEESSKPPDDTSTCDESSDDDWEAIADRAPNELLPSQSLPCVSNISLEDTKVQTTERRGRGPFSYKKHKLYCDQQTDEPFFDDIDDEDLCNSQKQNTEPIQSKYGTHHVLVLADFPPSTRMMDLEKLFEQFGDHGVVIRWVNDTTALAVFRTPSIALEAHNRIRCPFTLRILDEDDTIMGSISARDLEPPRQRPQTSARTAQRLIAQGMGLKLPATSFGSKELKIQEEARKNRIVTRQKMKDDAWGDDEK